jgi:hypothetical protein
MVGGGWTVAGAQSLERPAVDKKLVSVERVPCQHGTVCLQVADKGESLQIWLALGRLTNASGWI